MYWGAHDGFEYPTSSGLRYSGSSPDLKVNGSSYNYDLREIRNINSYGFSVNTTDNVNLFADDTYRNINDSQNNYFKKYDISTFFGDLGWIESEYELRIDGLGDGKQVITLPLSEEIPSGYYKTLAIIYNRNKLLDAYKNTQNQTGAFIRPLASKNYSELNELGELLVKADLWNYETWNVINGNNTYGSALYYPAASACFAYEPIGINDLNDKFKKYKWFLPSSGELARFLYYINQSNGSGQPVNSSYGNSYKEAAANAFDNVINEKLISRSDFYNFTFYSSTEANEDSSVAVVTLNGKCDAKTKSSSSYRVVPICMF
jgi:hypothetical protein